MDIALGIGIFAIIFYLIFREIDKIYDKLKKIENDIKEIKK